MIDCETCSVRGSGCSDCVISLFFGADAHDPPVPGEQVELDDAERNALRVLADAGLARPLRLVPMRPGAGAREPGRDGHGAGVAAAAVAPPVRVMSN